MKVTRIRLPPEASIRVGGKRKYKNKITVFDGRRFDSKKEAERYMILSAMEQAGKITELRCQVRIPIIVNKHKICVYIADFSYKSGGVTVFEDVKSKATRRIPGYRIKWKLLRACGIEIMEV